MKPSQLPAALRPAIHRLLEAPHVDPTDTVSLCCLSASLVHPRRLYQALTFNKIEFCPVSTSQKSLHVHILLLRSLTAQLQAGSPFPHFLTPSKSVSSPLHAASLLHAYVMCVGMFTCVWVHLSAHACEGPKLVSGVFLHHSQSHLQGSVSH